MGVQASFKVSDLDKAELAYFVREEVIQTPVYLQGEDVWDDDNISHYDTETQLWLNIAIKHEVCRGRPNPEPRDWMVCGCYYSVSDKSLRAWFDCNRIHHDIRDQLQERGVELIIG